MENNEWVFHPFDYSCTAIAFDGTAVDVSIENTTCEKKSIDIAKKAAELSGKKFEDFYSRSSDGKAGCYHINGKVDSQYLR